MSSKKKYEELSNQDKILAILACVEEPVTKKLALHLSGVTPRDQVLSVFDHENVTTSISPTYGQLYILNAEAKSQLDKSVDFVTVHKQIADVTWDDFFSE